MNMYGRQSDFFWSGHVGFMMLCARELWDLKFKKTCAIAVFVALFEAFTLICFRVHYTGDIVAGIVIGYWVHDVARAMAGPVDRLLLLDRDEDEKPLINSSS